MAKQTRLLTLFSAALCINWLAVAGLTAHAQVNPEASRRSAAALLSGRVNFVPPVDDGTPEHTAGAASRGRCPGDVAHTVPLVPNGHYGLTVSSRPTFFAYVPQTSAQTVFFSLKDNDSHYHYQATFPIAEKVGVYPFTLPDTAPALDPDRTYQWSFVLMCNGRLRPDSPIASGFVRYVTPESAQLSQLAGRPLLDQAIAYGDAGVWYDMLTALAALRQSHSDNSSLLENWESLLESAGIESEIATAPLTD